MLVNWTSGPNKATARVKGGTRDMLVQWDSAPVKASKKVAYKKVKDAADN